MTTKMTAMTETFSSLKPDLGSGKWLKDARFETGGTARTTALHRKGIEMQYPENWNQCQLRWSYQDLLAASRAAFSNP
jgi:hypothetical protein